MKLLTKLLLLTCLISIFCLFGSTSEAQHKLDSYFTLPKHIRQDKLDVGEHCVSFNEKIKQVFKDFNHIETLSSIDTQ